MNIIKENIYSIRNLSTESKQDLFGLEQLMFAPKSGCKTVPAGFFSIFRRDFKKIFIFIGCFFLINIAHGQSARLFESDELFELTLRADLKTVFKDVGDDPQYHKATLHYQEGQATFDIPIKIKTRGNSRKSLLHCQYPPLFLNFNKSANPKSSIFRDQDKTKLVVPCRGDQYVINEYLVYKLYNLITPMSFKARLVKVIYQDTVKNKSSDPYFGILLEEEKQMAKRNDLNSIEIHKLNPKKTNREVFLKMAVFQYLIGNTDWSVQYQQNIKLITIDSASIPSTVPYDFDNAGIVKAPYAKPALELQLSSTQQRRYRGYCMKNMEEFTAIFDLFNNLKDEFYSIYQEFPLLSSSYQKQTIKFLDQFYETINDPKKAKKAFLYPCDPSGTGNVIIQGLDPN